jgi:hemoglobin-like flavoprotein
LGTSKATIGVAVSSLERLDEILPTVQALGHKHAHQYNVPDSSYETVGQALLWTLGKGLGDAFTDQTR